MKPALEEALDFLIENGFAELVLNKKGEEVYKLTAAGKKHYKK